MDNWQTIDIPSHPMPNAQWVHCTAHIRNNQSGEIRQLPTNEILKNNEPRPSTFNWEHYNLSCDCNRHILFEQAIGNKLKSPKCSKGKFSVNLENPTTNQIYYREFQ